jgi:DNA transposition AAA+ family ATPase
MGSIERNGIVNALVAYCERYRDVNNAQDRGVNKAAASLKGVSAATVSHMLSGDWELIGEEMWRKVASQTGFRAARWQAVETANFKDMNAILEDAQRNGLVMAVTGDAGTGKTFACGYYRDNHKRVYMLCCNEYWNKKTFMSELLRAMGRDANGYGNVGEMMSEAVRVLKGREEPLLILDEADKLNDSVFYFFITLYNQLEDECGIVLCATPYLEKRLRNGIRLNKKGYGEIWSRLGRRCVELRGVSAADVVRICEENGVTEKKTMDRVLEDSDGDLRRVKRKVHAVKVSK